METNATKRTDIFLIDPRNIVVMDNFNVEEVSILVNNEEIYKNSLKTLEIK